MKPPHCIHVFADELVLITSKKSFGAYTGFIFSNSAMGSKHNF